MRVKPVLVDARTTVRCSNLRSSFYNFRHRHPKRHAGGDLPDALHLIGNCSTKSQGVCTDRAMFHVNLAAFGKTAMHGPERRLLGHLRYHLLGRIENPIFLYDIAQLYDNNTTRTNRFKKDLQIFLGLDTALPAMDGEHTRPKDERLDICEPRYTKLRAELLDIGYAASTWIRNYFLQSRDVYVSDRPHLESVLQEWKLDPCLEVLASA